MEDEHRKSPLDDSELGRWLSEVKVGDEARNRDRQQWLQRQASEQATFVGLLVDLAETSREVLLETSAARRHQGRVRGVGLDFSVFHERGRWAFIPHRTVAAVRAMSSEALPATGDREGTLDLTLLEALADQLEERPTVVVWLDSGERVQGELSGVGRDLVTIRTQDASRSSVHINSAAIAEVTFVA